MTQPLEIILFVKPKTISKRNSLSSYLGHRELQFCQNRKKMIEWFYGAQEHYQTARSTLFLSIQLLDRLILQDFKITRENREVIATSIFILSCKFNEAKRPSFKEINILLRKDPNDKLDEFLYMEREILEQFDYNIWEKEEIYDKLCQLEDQFSCVPREKVETIIQLALVNPQLFRYGHETLLKAVSQKIKHCTRLSEYCNTQIVKQVKQIFDELQIKLLEDSRMN